MIEAEDADCRGEAFLSATGGVDFGCEGVEGRAPFGSDGAEGVPEFRFKGDTAAVAAEGKGMLCGAGGHGWERSESARNPKSLSKDFDKFLA
jgi:hypothetical protein